MVPLSLAHRLVERYAPVRDVWRVLHPDSSLGAAGDEAEKVRGRAVPTAEENVRENGATCDSVLNTWRWRKEDQKRLRKGERVDVDGKTEDPNAKRLDYIFFSPGIRCETEWRVETARVGMMERHPALGCSLSDHFSVEATISKVTAKDVDQREAPARPLDDLLPLILPLIHTYTARQLLQRRLLLAYFLVALCVSIGCLIGIWWAPGAYVSFILALISTLSLSAGVISGMIGGFFIGSELRALQEFKWEIRNAGLRMDDRESFEEEVRDLF